MLRSYCTEIPFARAAPETARGTRDRLIIRGTIGKLGHTDTCTHFHATVALLREALVQIPGFEKFVSLLKRLKE